MATTSTRITIRIRPWVAAAACRSVPVDIFFPGEGYKGQYNEAALVCARCRVQPECLEWALTHEYHGFWAGTSERQRVQLRRAKAMDADVEAM